MISYNCPDNAIFWANIGKRDKTFCQSLNNIYVSRAKITGMNDKRSVVELPINASPVADHRRQMLWQVWLPLGVAIFIVLALIILTIVGAAQNSPQVSRWGNISAIIVILPVLLVGTLLLVIVLALVYGLSKLLKRMPGWMLSLQLRMVHISLITRRAADSVTRPVMTVNTTTARVKRIWDRFIRRKTPVA
jgi:hypothetical protein